MSRTITMAPGVYFQETDISQYVRELTDTILALVIVASKGPLDQAVLITSLQQGINTFGVPTEAYPGLLVMRNFFKAGGGRVYIVRVAAAAVAASVTVTLIDASTKAFDALTTGSGFNNNILKISYGSLASQAQTSTHTFTVGANTYSQTMAEKPLVAGTVVVKFGSTLVGTDNGAGVIVMESAFSLYSGTVNYNTGAIVISTTALLVENTGAVVNLTYNYWTSFNIQVQYQAKDSEGNVLDTYPIESYTNLNIANFLTSIRNSKVFKVATALASFPVAGTYQLAGGDDGADDITDADYIGNVLGLEPTGMQCFAYPDDLNINTLAIPGASSGLAVRQAMIQLCEVDRADTWAIIDPPVDLGVQDVADWANGNGDYAAYNTIDSNYAAIYFPWYSSFNDVTGENDLTPPSGMVVEALARSEYWEAPAGPIRGKAANIISIATKLNKNDRAFLAENRINAIGDLNGMGIMILGQQTATLTASSLDRVAARRALMRFEKAILTSLYPLLFEPNTPRTWNHANMIVGPYLKSLVANERIYAGKFICNRDTNPDEIINNNQLGCQVRLQLLKFAEIIVVNFIIEKVGASTLTETILNAQSAA